MERKLAAILAADVVGYSRLIREAEEETQERLAEYLKLIDTLVTAHHGRVFGGAGDSVIAEFNSPVEALRSAFKLQQEIHQRNQQLPDNRRLRFRVGLNLGDVMIQGDELYGDGVNVAVRVEELADPETVYISEDVYRQVKDKIKLEFEDRGDQKVKNIPEPVHVYRVYWEGYTSGILTIQKTKWRKTTGWIAAAILLVTGAGVAWNFLLTAPSQNGETAFNKIRRLELPSGPSIVVLPFRNLSGDAEQEYFSDGLTNDITTDLTKFHNILVIASNSAFSYKNQHIKVQQVAKDLGVQYLLEGTIQKLEEVVRVNVQLIDARRGHHIWAERYDRKLTDLLSVQNEIIETVVSSLGIEVNEEELERAKKGGAVDMNAQDEYWKAVASYSCATKEKCDASRANFEKVLELDPNHARARSWVGYIITKGVYQGFDPVSNLDLAENEALQAVSLDKDDYYVRWGLAFVKRQQGKFDKANKEYELALTLNSSDADLLVEYGEFLITLGKHQEALGYVEKAMTLNPKTPSWYIWDHGWTLYFVNRYQESIDTINRITSIPPRARFLLAANYVQLDEIEKARAEVKKGLEGRPDWTVTKERELEPFANDDDRQHWLGALRKAGLPEE